MTEPQPHIDANSSAISEEPLKVLVIEDDIDYANLMSAALKEQGCEVERAADHDLARELLASKPIDVIFCDGSTSSEYRGEAIRIEENMRCSGSIFLRDGDHIQNGKAVPIVTMSGGANGGYNDELRQYAERHGGQVFTSSKSDLFQQEQDGSFLVPVGINQENLAQALDWASAQKSQSPESAIDSAGAQLQDTKRILIMEDCEYHRATLQTALEERGYDVTAVDTHEEGRDLLKAGQHFDLAFCDGSTYFGFGSSYTADIFFEANNALENPIPTIGLSDNRTSVRKMDEEVSSIKSMGKRSLFGNFGADIYDSALDCVLEDAFGQQRGTEVA